MFREWLGSQVRLSSSSSLGDIGSSSSGVLGVSGVVEDRKKTGSRRRNVIKEDLVAEEQKTSGEFTHVQTTGNTYYFNIRASTLHTQVFQANVNFEATSTRGRRAPVLGPARVITHTHNLCGTFVPPFPYYSSKMREIEGPQHTSTTSQWQLAINPFCLDDRSAETHKNILNFLQLLACSFSLMLVQ